MNSSSINIVETATKQRVFSLPKTQPTKNSSTCHLQQLKNSTQTIVDQIQTCPEVSQFNIHDNSIYIHKMNIDYGHLEEPDNWHCENFENECKNQKLENEHNFQELEITQRNEFKFRYIKNNQKSTAGKSKSMAKFHGASTSELEIQPRLILLQSHGKKNTPIHQLDQFSPKFTKYNPEASSQKKKKKNKLSQTKRLKNVFASKNSVQSVDQLKNCSQQSTHRQDFSKQNHNEKDKTVRATQHCRIVRSYVGGSKMQIKIINYPDCSEYRKICGYNK